ncbi:DUF1302 family protein [Accumulibacter sp.]|uniref:DUF1302 family protein n=1 Tax=Accumulibacter sp. TaxID=2053492 RepID=UPI0028C4CF25|nr:DUF1302 family protein [Accumulibacter sp.]
MQIRNKQPFACLSLLLATMPMTALAELADRGNFPGLTLPARAASHPVPLLLAAKSDSDLPLSRDSLFGDVEPAAAAPAEPALPVSRDSLFGDDVLPKSQQVESTFDGGTSSPAKIHGFIENVMAYTTPKTSHWSQFLTRADVTAQGDLGSGIKWKLGARVDFDAVYPMSDFYPQAVNNNQTLNAMLRENYVDIGAGDWEFRLGRQHIIWGEMVGLLFGDVVSAKDMRHFVLPEFEILRIPQWAARAEYFKGDFHAEAIWIPVASYDNIGKPGAQFYAYTLPPPPGVNNVVFLNEKTPTQNLSNTNYGLRMSVLHNGWDVAGFAYSSMSVAPTFYRQIIPGATTTTATYQAQHERIDQYGSTVAKDLGAVVLKGEAVYTRGQKYQVTNLSSANGLVDQNTLTWVLGLDFTQFADTRINAQVFQSHFFDHNPYIIESTNENGVSFLVNHKFNDRFDAEALWIGSVNRTDWMLRPRVGWNFEKNWKLAVGVDIFQGPALGFFGRYDASDRVYSEVRYSF